MMSFRTIAPAVLALAAFVFAPAGHTLAPYFTLEIEELSPTNAPAIHSTAAAQYNGLWLFVTGHVDGLHRLFGGEAFPADKANNEVIVYNRDGDLSSSARLMSCPIPLPIL